MRDKLPIGAPIREEFVTNHIRWLEIHAADGGLYLLQHPSRDEPCRWDIWVEDTDEELGELLDDCEKIWGIRQSDWEQIEDTW